MVEQLNWDKFRNQKKIQKQGFESVNNLSKFSAEIKVKVEPLRTFNDAETLYRRRTRNNDQANKDLLNFVIDSILAEKWLSNKVPKSITKDVLEVVERSGGIKKWAESRPAFKEVFEKKKKKKYTSARKHLLNFIISSIMAGDWIAETLPDSTDQYLMDEVQKANGAITWAESQPNFKAVLAKKKAAKKPT